MTIFIKFIAILTNSSSKVVWSLAGVFWGRSVYQSPSQVKPAYLMLQAISLLQMMINGSHLYHNSGHFSFHVCHEMHYQDLPIKHYAAQRVAELYH